MFGSRLTKIIRDITARKVRTALVALSVFVGVLGVVVVSVMGQLVSRQLEKDIHTNELAMLRIFVDLPSNTSVDNAAVLRQLRAYPGVTTVEGQAVYEFKWKRPGETDFAPRPALRVFGAVRPDQAGTAAPAGRALSGRWTERDRHRKTHGRRPKTGDWRYADRARQWQRSARHDHRGMVYQPYFYIGGGDGSTSAYATYNDAQNIVRFKGYSSIYVRFKNFATSREQSSAFRKALMNQTPYTIVFYVVIDPEQQPVHGRRAPVFAGAGRAGAGGDGGVERARDHRDRHGVSEQRYQIGAMKALGADRLEFCICTWAWRWCTGCSVRSRR